MNEELIASIQNARFTPVRMVEGYDMGDVDQFLDRLVAALSAGEPVGELIEQVRFTPVRWREGYQMGDVDELLDRVQRSAVTGTGAAPSPDHGSTSTTHHASLVAAIASSAFTPVRMGEGYDMGEVDQLLDAISAALKADEPVLALIDGARFAHTHVREGYRASDVDEFLARLRRAVESGEALEWHQRQSAALDGQALADLVGHARFTPVLLAGAYDRTDVDQLLQLLAEALRAGRPVGALIDGARLSSSTRWREGYSRAEVDGLLERVRLLAESDEPTSLLPETPSQGQPQVGEPLPSAIVEQRSLLSRVFGRG